MIIKVLRYTKEGGEREAFIEYDVQLENPTLLQALAFIKTKIDPTLSFSSGCASSICGSCSMRVNEVEKLACSYKVKDGDKITALKNMSRIRDLVVNMEESHSKNIKAKAYSEIFTSLQISQADAKINELQSDCILCGSCYSACPVFDTNSEFMGPFSLTRVFRYIFDPRENSGTKKIQNIQSHGVWDCTLCGECTLVCPMGISSKDDISALRSKSNIAGFMDPNFSAGALDFGAPTF
ncbi:MAG: 4Fe-4S dicluster domain-containing protein [Helicobacteraceae bacterium]|nr:4Fe-4S dicluster domain-containing protein [Helicobacteraceae bacterium]